MKAEFEIENPKDIVATMTISMKIKEWEDLRVQLADTYPAWQLSQTIDELVRAAKKHFYRFSSTAETGVES